MLATARSLLGLTVIWLLCSTLPSDAQLNQPYVDRFASHAERTLQYQSNQGPSSSNGQILQIIQFLQTLSPDMVQQALQQSVTIVQGRLMAGTGATADSLELCLNHTLAIIDGITERQSWAIQMIDAMGKPLPGISQGNVVWPGAYDQCLAVRAIRNVSTPSGGSVTDVLFSGRYCTAAAILLANSGAGNPSTVSVGLCMPDSCSGEDVTALLWEAAQALNVSLLPAASCQSTDRPLETRTIAAIAVCGSILLLMMLGTAVDILYIQMPKWRLKKVSRVSANSYSTAFNGHIPNGEEHQLLLEKPDTAVQIPEPGVCIKVLAAFSVYTNGAKLLSTEQAPGSLTCIHGIRFLSMTWVVLGHAVLLNANNSANLLPFLSEIQQRWTFQAVSNALVSVDSFFLLSGLLVAYLSLKEMKKNSGSLNWFVFYFHRFWRLTPALMLVIMVCCCFLPYMGSGPFWPDQFPDVDNCKDNWWTNLLYINNLVREDKMCLGLSWYLANDMQFYILSPLIFVSLYYKPLLGAVSLGLFMIATTVTPAVLTVIKHFPPGFLVHLDDGETNLQDYMTGYYFKPWNRMGPYIVGLLAGYFLYRCNCKLHLHKFVNLILWITATACALAVVYGLYDPSYNYSVSLATSAFYNAVHRTVWGACVAWVVIACVTGNGGFVNTLLSWSGFVPLSRLTYCIYLVHMEIMGIYSANQQTVFYLDDVSLVMFFLSTLVVSCMTAFAVSLAFEAPMLGLEKILVRRK